jgi:predicted acylesterase/phospholipase RssA
LLVIIAGAWLLLRDSPPRYNEPLADSGPTITVPRGTDPALRGMWPNQPEQDDATLMMVAISGGGTRAAAVGLRTLETLQQIPYRFRNSAGVLVESNLAREIDFIAGISGGSFTAAAWALGRPDLPTFRQRFVERDTEAQLLRGLVSGNGVKALFSSRFDRIDLAADYYDRDVYEGQTFADLPPRPVLRIHATHLALGRRFTFEQANFSRLGSDLGTYPIGFACAASSAFPVLLSPITVRNFGPPLDLSLPRYRAYQIDELNSRQNLDAYYRTKDWEYYNDKSNAYFHLADGGLVDNQGLQSILNEFDTNGMINRRINHTSPPLNRLIIVNVNAGVLTENATDKSARAPGISSVLQTTMVASMDILSAKRWMDIHTRSVALYKAKIDRPDAATYRDLEEPYRIEVSFRNIEDSALRARASSLPTSFKLDEEQIGLIDRVVPALLREDPHMLRLLEKLKSSSQ